MLILNERLAGPFEAFTNDPAIRNFLSLFSEASAPLKAAVHAALMNAFASGAELSGTVDLENPPAEAPLSVHLRGLARSLWPQDSIRPLLERCALALEVAEHPPNEQVEKVRRAIFNVLSGEAEVNTGMVLSAVYEALGFPGIDFPPALDPKLCVNDATPTERS